MPRTETAIVLFVVASVACAQVPFRVAGDPLEAVPVDAATGTPLIGDFDGDGHLDALGSGPVVALNDGQGRFSAPLPATAPWTIVQSAFAADLSGDGLDDVVRSGPFGLSWSVNQGGLAFGPMTSLPLGFPSAGHAVAGDVDGDGDLDVLALTLQLNAVGTGLVAGPAVLLLNGGGGTFSVASTAFPATPLKVESRLFLRDVDGDGDLDAVCLESPSGVPTWFDAIVVFQNDGAGVFTATATQPLVPSTLWTGTVGDFDGDGYVDAFGVGVAPYFFPTIVSSNVPPVVAAPTFPNLPAFVRTFAADVDGDGADELVVGSSVYDVAGWTLVGPIAEFPGAVVRAPGRDFDGDGDVDFIGIRRYRPFTLFNTGAGGFVDHPSPFPGETSQGAVVADFDGDGREDLFWRTAPGDALQFAFGDGDGAFEFGPSTVIANPATPQNLVWIPTDLDQDGDLDVYGASVAAASFVQDRRILNLGGGVFAQPVAAHVTERVSTYAVVDWNADGKDDLLLGRRDPTPTSVNGLAGPMLYLQNAGGGVFVAPFSIGVNVPTFDLLVADFDGDGDPDALQLNGTTNSALPAVPCFLQRNVSGFFLSVPQFSMFGSYGAAGDFDGDGIADVAIDGQVWFGSSTGVFVPGPPLPAFIGAPATAADLDGDGDLDLIETPCAIFWNQGGGVFAPPVAYRPKAQVSPWIPVSVFGRSRVADVDRDGDLDVVSPYGVGAPDVFLNAMRQTTQRAPARLGGTVEILVDGSPGAAWMLFTSLGTANLASPFGPILIDPLSAQLVASGTFPPLGSPSGATASLTFAIPPTPSLAGFALRSQAADAGSGRLTNRLTTTLLAF
jgi:hypothetical protein